MQAATAGSSVIGQSAPQAGDCFTYEHLADRKHLWLDFCADTGDGGDSTYAVARAMAAPILQVQHRLVTSLLRRLPGSGILCRHWQPPTLQHMRDGGTHLLWWVSSMQAAAARAGSAAASQVQLHVQAERQGPWAWGRAWPE